MYGTIVELDRKSACGVIRPDDGSPDIYISAEEFITSGLKAAHSGERVFFAEDMDTQGNKHADHIVPVALMCRGNHRSTVY
ncbi:S1 domain-containing protein [Sphingomicrobium marinum]|uniref:cold shock domain-containing protein n=1 Tax=Sphingomicrobium marinum TaxID=1227950 RepID=UPI00223F886A|nr:cold shock domain-containing protein [Sphingomicrobium marinum]